MLYAITEGVLQQISGVNHAMDAGLDAVQGAWESRSEANSTFSAGPHLSLTAVHNGAQSSVLEIIVL